jgi:putative DNA primase/helicase
MTAASDGYDIDPEVRRIVTATCTAIRRAQTVPDKLEAITSGMAEVDRHTADYDALRYARDEFTESARAWGVNPDDAQAALVEGIHRNREFHAKKSNGKAKPNSKPNGAHTNGYDQNPDGWRENPEVLPAAKLESAKASTYKISGIRWFWPNRFALGKLGLIGGLPDRGKGLLTSDMMARATNGSPWPCNEGRAVQGNVALLTAEDDPEDTVVPRLKGAGADLDRVHIIKMVKQGDGKRMFNLVTDLALLKAKIEEIGNVVLIIIDPMSSYLGVGLVDARQTTDVRGVLAPLTELAAEKKISVIGVMHFNKKADVTNAMLRIADSLAFVAASRHCCVVIDDPENQRRLFVKAKNNLAPDMHALSYTIDTLRVGKDENGEIYAPRIIWGTEHVNVTATEAMHAEAEAGKQVQSSSNRDSAKKFLTEMLAMGPVSKAEIEDAAEGNGISERTLFRAKADLGIVAKKAKGGMKGGWMWSLPTQREGRQHDD